MLARPSTHLIRLDRDRVLLSILRRVPVVGDRSDQSRRVCVRQANFPPRSPAKKPRNNRVQNPTNHAVRGREHNSYEKPQAGHKRLSHTCGQELCDFVTDGESRAWLVIPLRRNQELSSRRMNPSRRIMHRKPRIERQCNRWFFDRRYQFHPEISRQMVSSAVAIESTIGFIEQAIRRHVHQAGRGLRANRT